MHMKIKRRDIVNISKNTESYYTVSDRHKLHTSLLIHAYEVSCRIRAVRVALLHCLTVPWLSQYADSPQRFTFRLSHRFVKSQFGSPVFRLVPKTQRSKTLETSFISVAESYSSTACNE